MADEIIRREYRFFGWVQGVGFRYRARYAAQLCELTGWVENLPDGSVLLQAQGRPDQLDRLVPLILAKGSWIHIEDMRVRPLPLAEREYGFSVRGW